MVTCVDDADGWMASGSVYGDTWRVWWSWRRQSKFVPPTVTAPSSPTHTLSFSHIHRDGSLMVLKSEVGGSLNLWGAPEDAYQTAPTGRAVHRRGENNLFTVCSFYLEIYHIPCISPCDLIPDNGRLINSNLTDLLQQPAPPSPHTYTVLQSQWGTTTCLPALLLFLKRRTAVVQPVWWLIILTTYKQI